jgi:hypothetical protein
MPRTSLTPTQKSRFIEEHSANEDDRLLEEARERFDSLSLGEQLELAGQLADCRRSEFTRRFRTVVNVIGGMKRQQGRLAAKPSSAGSACVVFFVRKKAREDQVARRPNQALPRYLLTPALVDGRQAICAVPTDVQEHSRLLNAAAQAETAVYSLPIPPLRADFGALACMVADQDGTAYALAPIHVLSPYPAANGSGIATTKVIQFRVTNNALPPDLTHCVEATSFGGRLAPHPKKSFDVQLAKVTDRGRLRKAFAGFPLSPSQPFVTGETELAQLMQDGTQLEILAPANHPRRLGMPPVSVLAKLSLKLAPHTLWYRFNTGDQQAVLHNVIELQIESGSATMGGDSGCPVVIELDDGYAFVGMHIAGDVTARTSFVIPAWELLDANSYAKVGGTLPSGGLTLLGSV